MDAVNVQLAQWTAAWAARSKQPRLVFQDCNSLFKQADGSIRLDRMPDGVHPQGEGSEALLKCMLRGLYRALNK